MREANVEVWLDQWKIVAGDEISREVEKGLKDADYLILMLSEHSSKSGWVEREWRSKFQQEIEAQEVSVLCVRLDECELPHLLSGKLYIDAFPELGAAAGVVIKSLVTHHRRRLEKNPMLHVAEVAERLAEQKFSPRPLTAIRDLESELGAQLPADDIIRLMKVESEFQLTRLRKWREDSPDEEFEKAIEEKERNRKTGKSDAFDALGEIKMIHTLNQRRAWIEYLEKWESVMNFCVSVDEKPDLLLQYLRYRLELLIREFVETHGREQQ